jgi:hypothetical protein
LALGIHALQILLTLGVAGVSVLLTLDHNTLRSRVHVARNHLEIQVRTLSRAEHLARWIRIVNVAALQILLAVAVIGVRILLASTDDSA